MSPSKVRFILLVAACVSTVYAEADRYAVSGQLLDPAGTPVPGTPLTLYSRTGTVSYKGATDAAGHYAISVPRGEYLVQVDKPGLQLSDPGMILTVDGPTDVTLHLSVKQVNSSIEVTPRYFTMRATA